ncbi:MAG: Tyrosine-protein kinase MasK [Myxococcota bacterium]|nr:Tyrosine-protein kinase MasK [Myxococcota bacterium]
MTEAQAQFEARPFGKYLLLNRIGKGGMAEIFFAKTQGPEEFEKFLVIKRILPSYAADSNFVSQFIDEARIASTLTHKNIVQVFDMGQAGGEYYIAMEYVDGRDLRDVLRTCIQKEKPISTAAAAYVTAEILQGLSYAHRKVDYYKRNLNIIHRDISPQNVLVSYEGEVRITDFGIAKASTKITETREEGRLVGKLSYMSPEQARATVVDARTDIYSTGIIFWELLTCHKCFHAENQQELLRKLKNPEAPPPSSFNPNVPKAFDEIALKALQPDRDKRYQTADEFLKDMYQAASELGLSLTPMELSGFMHGIYGDEAAHKRSRIYSVREIQRRKDMLSFTGDDGETMTNLAQPKTARFEGLETSRSAGEADAEEKDTADRTANQTADIPAAETGKKIPRRWIGFAVLAAAAIAGAAWMIRPSGESGITAPAVSPKRADAPLQQQSAGANPAAGQALPPVAAVVEPAQREPVRKSVAAPGGGKGAYQTELEQTQKSLAAAGLLKGDCEVCDDRIQEAKSLAASEKYPEARAALKKAQEAIDGQKVDRPLVEAKFRRLKSRLERLSIEGDSAGKMRELEKEILEIILRKQDWSAANQRINEAMRILDHSLRASE